jgi:pyruvate kinase
MTDANDHPVTADRLTQVKTKIVATVGPACAAPGMLRQLVLAGVDVFRLNFAHGKHEWLEGIVQTIRSISAEMERPIGILGDLSGPKIRLGALPNDEIICESNAKFEFIRGDVTERPDQLTCTYEFLVDELRVGDRIMLADGTVSMRVIEKEADKVVCVVEQSGPIRSRQGINLPGVALSTPSLTDKDRVDLAWACKIGLDYIGLSFVRSADDIRGLRSAIADQKPQSEPHIVAKIEKMEAISQLEEILQLTDVVMVARGDLGVEVDLASVPIYQKRIIRLCNEHRVPVITATQMLDSMEQNSRPTRAEAADVANAVLDGSDAVMLSGETAAGKYPLESVQTMNRILREAQRLLPSHSNIEPVAVIRSRALMVTEAVVLGAGRAAEHLHADLIVIASHSGRTAMAVSSQRNRVPILGLSDASETARRMCLYWGISALQTEKVHATPQELLRFVVEWGRKRQIIGSGSKIVLVASTNWSAEGHDLMMVHAIP